VEGGRAERLWVSDEPAAKSAIANLDAGILELTEARRTIEGEACALAAAAITAEGLTRLVHCRRRIMRGATARPGCEAERESHLVIADASRNSIIAELVRHLFDKCFAPTAASESVTRAYQASHSMELLDAILNALEAGDPQAARDAMHRYFDRVIE